MRSLGARAGDYDDYDHHDNDAGPGGSGTCRSRSPCRSRGTRRRSDLPGLDALDGGPAHGEREAREL
jgi:hypothetical protein